MLSANHYSSSPYVNETDNTRPRWQAISKFPVQNQSFLHCSWQHPAWHMNTMSVPHQTGKPVKYGELMRDGEGLVVRSWGSTGRTLGEYIFQKSSLNVVMIVSVSSLIAERISFWTRSITRDRSQRWAAIMNDLAIALFASASVFLFFAWLAMSLRMYVRITMIKAVGVDDYLMIAALVGILNLYSMVR